MLRHQCHRGAAVLHQPSESIIRNGDLRSPRNAPFCSQLKLSVHPNINFRKKPVIEAQLQGKQVVGPVSFRIKYRIKYLLTCSFEYAYLLFTSRLSYFLPQVIREVFVRLSLSVSCFLSDRISLQSMPGELKKGSPDLFRGGGYACRCDCQSKGWLWKDNYCD